ncbi:MAG: MATE family efflux transporter [Opitutales bacterium]|jgi:MATE family multidrug resistance protein
MSGYIKEIRETLKLGTPMIIGQLTTMAMALTDTVMVGRGVGTDALAAMAFALNFMNMPLIGLYGLALATGVDVARAYGGGRSGDLPKILQHGLVICFFASVLVVGVMCVAFWNLYRVDFLGQPPRLIPLAKPYVLYYGAAFVFQLLAGNCRAYCESQSRPWLPMVVVMGSILLNALLDWMLIYGTLGLPKMGLRGAGLATLISAMAQLFILIAVIIRNGRLHLTLNRLLHLELERAFIRRHLALGLPAALQIGLEISSMSIVALIVGKLGAVTLAAHHVTLQVAGLAFMVPLGLSFAVSIRVGQAAGAGNGELVRRVCNSSLVFAMAIACASSFLLLSFRHLIPQIFTKDIAVVGMVSSFLVVAALFQLFDDVQCTAMGALRGLRDVKLPTWIMVLNHWIISMPLAWLLCITLGMGGIGAWIAMAIALALSATFLTLRLVRVYSAVRLKTE